MCKELTVILKDSERTYRQKFLVYEDISLSIDDPMIKVCIETARKNFAGDPDDIQIRIFMCIK